MCVENAWKQKTRKAPDPDNVSPTCLKVYADQLTLILYQLFKRSLELCEVPSYIKRSKMNYYKPVAEILKSQMTS